MRVISVDTSRIYSFFSPRARLALWSGKINKSHLLVELLLLFSLAGLVVWSNPHLINIKSDDTAGYLAVAKNLKSESSQDRPIGYPAVIMLGLMIGGDDWGTPVIILQMVSLVILGWIFYRISRVTGLSIVLSFLVALLIVADPNLLSYTSTLLPEFFLGSFIVLAWACLLLAIFKEMGSDKQIYILCTFTGILSGIAVLMKPVWILGFIPLAVCAWYFIGRNRRSLYAACMIVLFHLAIWGIWQMYVFNNFGQLSISRTGVVNINLSLLRMGLIDSGQDTVLYNYLAEKKLLASAQDLEWNDFEQFTLIKDQIPWDVRSDTFFANKVLLSNPWKFLKIQAERWPFFFQAGLVSPINTKFPLGANITQYIYLGFYNRLFKSLLLIMLAISCLYAVRIPKAKPVLLIGITIILYLSCVLCLLTYQDPQFTRMRVSVEPLLLFIGIYPFLVLFDKAILQIYPRMRQ